ncbi:MAG TPA: hypothetical protein PKW52_00475 [Nitrospira sp.]|nr:hypothetical protein [Nitrospira sp. NTP1]HQR14015.1 hypothetical protein [Nitrospira sp.]HQV09790.1 hypothetical protein [Nitrospira sp.]
MKLDLSLEEARVLDIAVEYIKRHKDIAAKIYAGYEDDMKTINAVGGTIRAAYLNGKRELTEKCTPRP